jgi:hypothetical protein
MEGLLKLIESALSAASGSCTGCVIDELGNEYTELPGAIVALQNAYASRSSSAQGEENLINAFMEFMELVTQMAVFTGELMYRPGVRWLDETIDVAVPIIVIPN